MTEYGQRDSLLRVVFRGCSRAARQRNWLTLGVAMNEATRSDADSEGKERKLNGL